MDCKITSINARRPRERASRGFTLLEGVLAMGIGSMLMIAVASMIFFSARSFAALANYVDLNTKSRVALDQMSRDIRNSDRMIHFSTNRLEFLELDATILAYVHDPEDRTLSMIRMQGTTVTETKVLLTECDSLEFQVFARNPRQGTYDQYPAGVPANAKLVRLQWVSSRDILGKKATTESVQTARIVIRNQ
jgi:type II secretory pathway component PulJ